MTASNFFQAVNYHPDESQILTTGTDRKVTNGLCRSPFGMHTIAKQFG
jgi:hypothetical protein